MDHIIKEEHYETPLYEIFPSQEASSQTLQIVLMPNQSIICPKNSVLYTSKKVDKNTIQPMIPQGKVIRVLS